MELGAWNFRRRGGFTFTEVMFAVIILGVGFIMVAAIFPVAIQQSQANLEDATGAAVIQQGKAIMSQMGPVLLPYNAATNTYTLNVIVDPPLMAPRVAPFLHRFSNIAPSGIVPLNLIKGNMIVGSDPRYAWYPVAYQCCQPNAATPVPSSITVYLLAVKVRNRSIYTNTDLAPGAVTFQPSVVYFKLVEGGNVGPDTVVFTDINGIPTNAYENAAEGAYVWVVDDGPTGAANGRFYRLGVKRDDLNNGVGVWELAPGDGPGHDMTWLAGPDGVFNTPDDITEDLPAHPGPPIVPHPLTTGNYAGLANPPAAGFMIGRGTPDPLVFGPPFEGPAQDVLAISSIAVPIK